MYAPLGTFMSLGDHVRLTRTFIEAFKTAYEKESKNEDDEIVLKLHNNLKVCFYQCRCSWLSVTITKAYQDQLAQWGIKDDRIRRPLARPTILSRLLVRLTWALCLFSISLPGLILWLPIFASTFYAVHNFKKTGPIFDTWDEIAQYKLIYGLISGLCVWILGVALTWPFALATLFLIPAFMWMTLRWLEDAVAAFRAFTALFRLLCIGTSNLERMLNVRRDLHSHVMNLAIIKLDLPENPESHFSEVGGKEKGRVRGRWESGARYFSIKRRRKRDWNETLRLYDKVDYPLIE